MLIKLNTKQFKNFLNTIKKLDGGKATQPVTGVVRLDAYDNGITLRHFKGDAQDFYDLEFTLPAIVEDNLDIPIGFEIATITKIVRGLSCKTITLEVKNDRVLVVKNKKDGDEVVASAYHCDYPEDIPTFTQDKPTFQQEFDALLIKDWLERGITATSREETRYYLNGLQMFSTDNWIQMNATDGHRLLQINSQKFKQRKEQKFINYTLRNSLIESLNMILKDIDEEAMLMITGYEGINSRWRKRPNDKFDDDGNRIEYSPKAAPEPTENQAIEISLHNSGLMGFTIRQKKDIGSFPCVPRIMSRPGFNAVINMPKLKRAIAETPMPNGSTIAFGIDVNKGKAEYYLQNSGSSRDDASYLKGFPDDMIQHFVEHEKFHIGLRLDYLLQVAEQLPYENINIFLMPGGCCFLEQNTIKGRPLERMALMPIRI